MTHFYNITTLTPSTPQPYTTTITLIHSYQLTNSINTTPHITLLLHPPLYTPKLHHFLPLPTTSYHLSLTTPHQLH